MYKKSIIFIAIILGLMQVQAYSQAKATVHLNGGYNVAIGDLKGDFDNLADSNTYLMHNGYSFGFIIKKAYGRGGNLRGTGNINFSVFSQSKHVEEELVTKDAELTMNILTIGFGGEWAFAPKRGKLNPFVGAELCFNYFTGSLVWSDDYVADSLDQSADLSMKPSLRFGVQIGGGIDFQIHQSIGFITGVKYSWTNILGKKWERDSPSEYKLKDGEYTEGNYHLPARNITFLQIYGGFSYYFGR
ncbi:MAG: hypothetical protein EHM58_16370 [Ignavibacteriae bacterium]|nr:MAG: hypothetical protein EHM58_16370 [Ignavibacteriota bacterium]